MELVLPAKANKQDVNHQMAQKANLEDIQSTIAEIARNIESKVGLEEYRIAIDDKVNRAEFSLRLQEKVCFDDMKRYVTLNAAGGANTTGPSTGGNSRQFEAIDEEMRNLKERVDDATNQLQSMR